MRILLALPLLALTSSLSAGSVWPWVIEGVTAGTYRVVYTLPAERHWSNEPDFSPFFVNGVCLPLDRATGNGPDPADPKHDIRQVVTQPVRLKPGDVITLRRDHAAGVRDVSLASPKVDPQKFWLPAYRLEDCRLEKKIDFTRTKMTPGKFILVLTNCLGKPGDYAVELSVKDYWRNEIARKAETVTLKDAVTIELPFSVDGLSESYRGYVTVTLPSGEKVDWAFTTRADVTKGYHRTLDLDRGWEVTWVEDDGTYATRCFRERPPETNVWKKVDLPHTLKSWSKVPNAHQRWFRKTFTVPAAHCGERYELQIERGAPLTKVWLNGVCLGENEQARLGTYLRYDMTAAIRPDGTNDLFIACQERTRAYRDEDLKTAKTLNDAGAMLFGWDGYTWGVFGLVKLVTTPKRALLQEPKVITSFRDRTIEVRCDVPGDCTVSHRVLDRGREVLGSFAGKTTWENPILWGPTEFPLLELESTLRDAATDKILDVRRTRFGFREFVADGIDLKWNGKVVKGAGRAMMPRWGENAFATDQFLMDYLLAFKKNGNVFGRHMAGIKDMYDIADELGVPCTKGPGTHPLGCYPAKYRGNATYWSNFKSNVVMIATDYPNNPSIFTWYLSNEFYFESFPEAQAEIAPAISALQRMDPMRFCETGCDIDCGGRTKIVSTHYPLASPFGEENVYLPDGFYWRKLGQMFYRGMPVPDGLQTCVANQYVQSPIRWGTKPVMVNETNWDYFMRYPHGPTRLWGDDAYLGTKNCDRLHTLYAIEYLKGERDAEVTCITNWRQMENDDTNLILPREEAFAVQRYHAFYEGTPVVYDLDFMHDVFKAENLVRYWKVTDASGNEVAGERIPWAVDFCAFARTAAKFTAPKAGRYAFSYGIEGRVNRVFPFTTHGKEPLAMPLRAGADRLVKATDPVTPELLKRAEAGETIILLPRDEYPEELAGVLRMTLRKSAVNFTFRPSHPVLKDISSDDLSYWYPDHATGDRYFSKPASGGVKTIVEAGGPRGLVYSALVEIPYGRGAILATRLELDPESNPIAAKLLANMLAYRAQPAEGTLAVLFDPTAPIFSRLKKMGVSARAVTPETLGKGAFAAVYVDGGRFGPETVLGFGGKILVHDPSEAWRVTRRKMDYPWYRGRAVKMSAAAAEPLLAGLTNTDFFWRQRVSTENVKAGFFDPAGADCDLGGREIMGATDLVYPRFLVRKGRMLMDDLNWITPAAPSASKAERVITTVFANAGVKVAGGKVLTIPRNLAFKPVDISKFLTRGLADDVENDGVGGWSDQGPKQDMHEWKIEPGAQRLGGVDYAISQPNALVALKSKYRNEKGVPESVTFPVNRPADWLFWLHAEAWCSKQVQATMTVKYADGSTVALELGGSTNMRDYCAKSPEAPFTDELETVTTCAATAPHKTWGKGAVYSTGWKNPKPKATVESVTFTSQNRGVVMILALTTGVEGGKARSAEPSRDAAKCQKLLAAADRARKAGDRAKALGLLKDANAADPSRIEIYQDIGDLAMELDDPETALGFYRAALERDYNQPPLWTKEKAAATAVEAKRRGKTQ